MDRSPDGLADCPEMVSRLFDMEKDLDTVCSKGLPSKSDLDAIGAPTDSFEGSSSAAMMSMIKEVQSMHGGVPTENSSDEVIVKNNKGDKASRNGNGRTTGEEADESGKWFWEQKGEEIQIRFPMQAAITKADVSVRFKRASLCVAAGGLELQV